MAFYRELESSTKKVKIINYGSTDVGKPLEVVVVTGNGVTIPDVLRKEKKRFVMVINGIHAGESCGVDASMMMVRDLATDNAYAPLLDNLVVLVIPVYNIGGSLNRSCCTRANQVGPEEQGFRGNGRNLDLNRDFIKADSRNARAFQKAFQTWRPDVLIDTHTSDGADYPYTLTLIHTQKDKMQPALAEYMTKTMVPDLYDAMGKSDYQTCPYVDTYKETPDSGIVAFMDLPRYSTGYASLWNTIGFTTEAHMLKSFEDRVESTYIFMLSLLKTVNRDRVFIQRARDEAIKSASSQEEFVLKWKLKTTNPNKIPFTGYTASYKKSKITGMDRLWYDRDRAWKRDIPYYDTYTAELKVTKPEAYIVPQAWSEVVDRMKISGVEVKQLSEDIEIDAEVSRIQSYESTPYAYEGHYLHYNTKLNKATEKCRFFAGDYVIYTNQGETNRYIVETLEAEGPDSWFSWGFFDEILFQKEYFSAYIFENEAEKIVAENPSILEALNTAKASDTALANNSRAQLDFIYQRSKYKEKVHNRYPVVRVDKKAKLPLKK
ncbi:MAG: M14 family metallopeptidase [Bacteroidia bacterium]|nr:M14 family metallopeptidase [Bacteroidia bacterium]